MVVSDVAIRATFQAMLGLLLAAAPSHDKVAANTPVRHTAEATGADLLGLADDFARRGRSDHAEQVLTLLANDADGKIRSEARFRLAMMASSAGRLTQAAVLLRQILDEQPEASRVRLELAMLLHKMGDEQSALRHLRGLRSTDLPPNLVQFVDRLSASLRAAKPLGFNLELALAPDSNINRATRSDTLGTVFGDFTIDQKKKSGVGAAVRALGQARLSMTDSLNLVVRASSEANIYRDQDFNDIALDVAAGPEWQAGRVRVNAELGASQQWYGMKPYQRSVRIGASAVIPIGVASQLRIDASARRSDNRFNDLQDGRGASGQVRFERALSQRLMVSASLGADRFRARDAAYSTRSWRAGIAAYREVGSLTVNLAADIGRLEADDRLQLLPKARSDRSTRVSLGMVMRRLTVAGFSPMTRLVIERNQSTVAFYDYKRVRSEFGIARAF